MRDEPFTLYEAEVVSQAFQYLAGSRIETDKEVPIEEIIISPFDDINKWMFLYLYRDYKDARKALSHYNSPFYDVIVTAQPIPNSNSFRYKDIRTYLTENNIPFDLNVILDKNFELKKKSDD
jgi:hypothetical protein